MQKINMPYHLVVAMLALLLYLTPGSIKADLLKEELPEKPMVIVIPSYNNVDWYEANLKSVFMQKYSNYRVIYINDCSQDGTDKAVADYVKNNIQDYQIVDFNNNFDNIGDMVNSFNELINAEPHFFTLVNNVNRCGAMENLYKGILSCKDNEICITLDGDDWLYHDRVLQELNTVYSGEVWFTHGTIKEYPWGHVAWSEPVPPEAIQNNTYRKYKCPGHLRTFYTWLFKKIKLEDLLWHGKFFPMTWDMTIMYPLCEMASERHAFISEVNMVYNMANSINDNKVNAQLQNDLDHHIRNMPRYSRLEKAEFNLVDQKGVTGE